MCRHLPFLAGVPVPQHGRTAELGAELYRPAPAESSMLLPKFDPEVAKLIRAARTALRKLFPTSIEQVYDNYNFLVIGFCTTERTSDCIVSVAANSKGVGLSFYHGATLPDRTKFCRAAESRTA